MFNNQNSPSVVVKSEKENEKNLNSKNSKIKIKHRAEVSNMTTKLDTDQVMNTGSFKETNSEYVVHESCKKNDQIESNNAKVIDGNISDSLTESKDNEIEILEFMRSLPQPLSPYHIPLSFLKLTNQSNLVKSTAESKDPCLSNNLFLIDENVKDSLDDDGGKEEDKTDGEMVGIKRSIHWDTNEKDEDKNKSTEIDQKKKVKQLNKKRAKRDDKKSSDMKGGKKSKQREEREEQKADAKHIEKDTKQLEKKENKKDLKKNIEIKGQKKVKQLDKIEKGREYQKKNENELENKELLLKENEDRGKIREKKENENKRDKKVKFVDLKGEGRGEKKDNNIECEKRREKYVEKDRTNDEKNDLVIETGKKENENKGIKRTKQYSKKFEETQEKTDSKQVHNKVGLSEKKKATTEDKKDVKQVSKKEKNVNLLDIKGYKKKEKQEQKDTNKEFTKKCKVENENKGNIVNEKLVQDKPLLTAQTMEKTLPGKANKQTDENKFVNQIENSAKSNLKEADDGNDPSKSSYKLQTNLKAPFRKEPVVVDKLASYRKYQETMNSHSGTAIDSEVDSTSSNASVNEIDDDSRTSDSFNSEIYGPFKDKEQRIQRERDIYRNHFNVSNLPTNFENIFTPAPTKTEPSELAPNSKSLVPTKGVSESNPIDKDILSSSGSASTDSSSSAGDSASYIISPPLSPTLQVVSNSFQPNFESTVAESCESLPKNREKSYGTNLKISQLSGQTANNPHKPICAKNNLVSKSLPSTTSETASQYGNKSTIFSSPETDFPSQHSPDLTFLDPIVDLTPIQMNFLSTEVPMKRSMFSFI